MAQMGIYMILNIDSGKFYIGSSNNLPKRKREHFWALSENVHNNSYLQNAYNKHGAGSFRFSVVEDITDEGCLLVREQYYIDSLKVCDRAIGYNINEYATGGGLKGENNPNYGKPMTSKQKEKIRASLMGHKHTEETKRKISERRKNKYGGSNHYLYGKTLSEERKRQHSVRMKGLMVGANNPSARAVVQLSPNGEYINLFNTIKEACESVKVQKSNLCKCCRGQYKTTGGFKWVYANEYEKQFSTF